jgi:hypothetical protein
MQQPYLIGETATDAVIDSIEGKQIHQIFALPVLIVTKGKVDQMLPTLRKRILPPEGK